MLFTSIIVSYSILLIMLQQHAYVQVQLCVCCLSHIVFIFILYIIKFIFRDASYDYRIQIFLHFHKSKFRFCGFMFPHRQNQSFFSTAAHSCVVKEWTYVTIHAVPRTHFLKMFQKRFNISIKSSRNSSSLLDVVFGQQMMAGLMSQ